MSDVVDLVSIVTPAFNAELFIEETLKSVIAQTYMNWEMIVVDDNSSDNTKDVVIKYSNMDKRIKLIALENNRGVANARNVGISKSSGRFISFLDSDDLWDKRKLEKQVKYMKDNNYCITFTSYSKFKKSYLKPYKIIYAPKKMDKNDILKNTIIGCLTVMIDSSQVKNIKMPNLDHCEDQCTWISILNQGFSAYGIEDILAHYRVNTNSLSGNKVQAVRKQWSIYRKYHCFSLIKTMYYFFCYILNVLKR